MNCNVSLSRIVRFLQQKSTIMAKKKMTKQEKKKAEAEQAELLRIEMEKERHVRFY